MPKIFHDLRQSQTYQLSPTREPERRRTTFNYFELRSCRSPLKIILRISWEQSRKEIQNNPLSLSNYSDKTHGEMNSYFEEESLKTNLWKYVAWKSEPNPTRASFVRPPSSKKNFDLINPKSENFSEIWRFQVWFN